MAFFGKARKADVLGEEDSILGRVAKRRKADLADIEAQTNGEPPPVAMKDAEEPEPGTDDRRGYTKEKW